MPRPPWIPLVAALLFGLLAWRFSFVCDDAYIAFRYSHNLAAGLGACFHPGAAAPVEGYTQFGWVLWIGAVEWLGGDPTVWSRVTTVACGLALLTLVGRSILRRQPATTLPVAAGLLLLAGHPAFGVWATGGLETMAFALLVFVTWERLLGDPAGPHALAGGLAGAATLLMRSDGLYWVLAVVGLTWCTGRLRGDPRLRRAAWIAAALALTVFAAHIAWRLQTYDDWLPQTARAKVGLSAALLERGARYVASWFLTFPLGLALLLLGAWHALGRRTPDLGSPVAMAALCCLYPVLVGGDFMAFGRFLVPALPFLALIAAGLFQHALAGDGARRAAPLAALLVALLGVQLLPAFDLHVTPRSWREAVHFRWNSPVLISEFDKWNRMRIAGDTNARLGRALALHVPPDETLVCGALGGVGYYSGLFLYDRHGYVNRDVTARPRDPERPLASPGHDARVDPLFFAPWRPTYRQAFLRVRDKLPPGSSARRIIELDESQGFLPNELLVLVPFDAPFDAAEQD